MPSIDQLQVAARELGRLPMPHLGLNVVGVLTGCIALFVAYRAYRFSQWHARTLPGPPLHSISHGSLHTPFPAEQEALYLHQEWFQKYGPTFRFWQRLARPAITTIDPSALRHMLSSPVYQKGQLFKAFMGDLIGEGLLFVEGSEHKRQRRVMNPAFGPLQVRRFTETFLRKSLEMRDVWISLCERETTRKDGYLRIDAFAWLNKVTLDIIGLAGFDYDIDSLHAPDDSPNELNDAVRIIFSMDVNVFVLLQFLLGLRKLPTERTRTVANAQRRITEIGMRLIGERKAAVMREMSSLGSPEKKDIQGSDLLSLLLKANMASDLPESARMSDSDIVAQVPTFLIAGHETTSTAVTWGLYAMSCNQRVQQKLRQELSAVSTDMPSEAELNQLPYLDAVVREVLRIYAPVYSTDRTAVEDDIVPLKTPYTGPDGVVHHELHISKGDTVIFPIQVINRSAEYWGEDAHEFRPERWSDLPDAVKDLPGVYSNMLTFFAGTHACIGYRFSINEMKALIFTIVKHFEFELPIPPMDIMRKSVVVGRPVLATNPAAGSQLPLLIRPVSS